MLVSAVAFTNGILPSATPVNAESCKDVEFIFARGSGSSLNAESYQSWEKSFRTVMSSDSLSYNFYELGSASYDDASYPAVSVGIDRLDSIVNSLSATVSALRLGSFNESVETGVKELLGRIRAVTSSCPNTKFVLGGYSQGGMVISRALGRLIPEQIAFVATFGDPVIYLPEGKGINPPACRGIWYSPYRIDVPNCLAYTGLLGANEDYQLDSYFGKIGVWCTEKDIFCSKSINFGNLLGDHTSYVKRGIYLDAAQYIRKRLATIFPEKIQAENATVIKRNVAIVIDSTFSMQPKIDAFKETAAKIAKTTLDNHGEVALLEYRDLKEDFQPKLIVNYGSSYEDFMAGLNQISVADGDDFPESALSGLMHSMNRLEWQKGATKSIVLLTDAPYHSPDLDGTTFQAVIRRSLEIDPVNIYTITTPDVKETYESLTAATGGASFVLQDDAIPLFTSVLHRPELSMTQEQYVGNVGEELSFAITPSLNYDGETYEWDLDGDGVFEKTTTTPSVTTSYAGPLSTYIQAKITTRAGIISTASAKLEVIEQNTIPIALDNLNYSIRDDSLEISYSLNNSHGAIVIINDIPLGIVSSNLFTVQDYHGEELTIALTPFDETGQLGEQQSLKIQPVSPQQLSTHQATNQPNSQSADQSDNQPANQPIIQSDSQPADRPTNQSAVRPPIIFAPNAGAV